ncbi:hypothetical protein PAHAL_2G105600 [Panicum hallii]|uniref:Bifunctional inhibitor/plant lipid transfer protein/seed storage helical domain-containing protein n=1 Tax=Panicum hallii TaxID=206008 RepID=A0A2T8KNN9_9POAL|nr:hypothetical protein PAHAL_2G105600 [Panicum hallii]
MARRVKAPAPPMAVAATALLLLLTVRAQAGGDEAAACSSIPVFMACMGPEGLRAPTTSADPDEHKALSAECCNCLCRLRDELRRRGVDPERFLCTADTGCHDA